MPRCLDTGLQCRPPVPHFSVVEFGPSLGMFGHFHVDVLKNNEKLRKMPWLVMILPLTIICTFLGFIKRISKENHMILLDPSTGCPGCIDILGSVLAGATSPPLLRRKPPRPGGCRTSRALGMRRGQWSAKVSMEGVSCITIYDDRVNINIWCLISIYQ